VYIDDVVIGGEETGTNYNLLAGDHVRAVDNHFILDDKRYYFAGANAEYMFSVYDSVCEELFDDATNLHVGVVRTWAFHEGQEYSFQPERGVWNELAFEHLDRIVARFIADAGTRSAAMETQEVHMGGFSAIPPVDVKRLAALPHIATTNKGYEMQAPIVQLDFNTTKPPFDDVRVRQAVAYAIDRRFVLDNIWFGFGRPATGPIHSNFKANGLFTTTGMKNYDVPNGVELANKLLDEAGKKRGADGTRFEIVHDMTPYGDEWRRLGEYVQQQLGKVGIKVTLRYEDVPTWLRRVYTNYDFQLTSNWIQTLADPTIGVHRLYHSGSIKPGTVFVNSSRWNTKETDDLMDKANVELDAKKRADLYHQLQRRVNEASPIVYLHELDFITVYNKRVQGFPASPLGLYSAMDQVWLSR
jgi:peptide/nickel transport system substrate-binding protein